MASAAPRRNELLKKLGIDFRVSPSRLDESRFTSPSVSELVQTLALEKAESLIQEKINTDDQNKLVDDYLNKVVAQ